MPSAGSSSRRGAFTDRDEPARVAKRRGPSRVEAALVSGATVLLLIVFGLTVSSLLLAIDPTLSSADARGREALALSPTSGRTGTTVTVYGRNFSGSVQLLWDGSAAGMPQALTDQRGRFETTFVVPGSAAVGAHAVAASSSAARVSFSVTASSATPAPTPATPAPTPQPTATATVTAAPTPAPTPRPTATATVTAAPTPAPTLTASPTVVPTPAPTVTASPTVAPTPVPTPTRTATPPSGSLSPLHVSGPSLVNALGQPVQLRGVNYSGPEYACIQGWGIFDGPNDAASVQAIAGWRANAVRVPMNEDCWLNINGSPAAYSGATYQQAIKSYVSLLNQNGLYAILELHWTAPGTQKATGQQPMLDRDHSVAFWTGVAAAFAGNDRVIFEAHNEPYPDGNSDTAAAWRCWRDGGTCSGVSFQAAGMQEIVTAIRATGATNVIALGGVQYSNALSQWLAYRPSDPLNNLAAAWHIYNFNVCSTTSCWNSTAGVVLGQVPVIATEIGDDSCNATFMNALMGWLDGHGSGYLAWTWDTWGTACGDIALIRDYSGTPTTYGQIYKTHLAAP
jgi:endoglucanase